MASSFLPIAALNGNGPYQNTPQGMLNRLSQDRGWDGRVLDEYGFPIVNNPAQQSEPVIPHPLTFGYVLNTIARTYSFRWDEALRQLPNNALAMWRDAYLRSLINERCLATANRSWQIKTDDEDPTKKLVCQGLQRIIRRTPEWRRLLEYLMNGVWYGRYGAQITYGPKNLGNGTIAQGISQHWPVNGDKIQYKWDAKTPAIFINQGSCARYPQQYIVWTDRVPALVLAKSEWREQFIIHRHQLSDADYFEGEMAGAVGGVGLRSAVYWTWWLRDECLSWVMDFMKKAGALGLLIFWYELGNNTAKQSAIDAAQQSSKDTALVMGRPGGKGNEQWGVDHIGMNMSGVEHLQNIIQHYFEDHMERLIVGQTLSANTEGSGLGGSGVAGMHEQTKFQLQKFDADNLGDTLTADLVAPLIKKNYPSYEGEFFEFVFNIEKPDAQSKVSTVSSLAGLGVTFDKDEVRDELTGFSKPADGADVIGGQPGAGGPGGPGGPSAAGAAQPGAAQPGAADAGAGGMGAATDQAGGPAGAAEPAGGAATGEIFDWQPTASGKGLWSPSARRWKPLKYAGDDVWVYATDAEMVAYIPGAPDNGINDWRPTRTGRGEYSPSRHRWRPIGSGQQQQTAAAPAQGAKPVQSAPNQEQAAQPKVQDDEDMSAGQAVNNLIAAKENRGTALKVAMHAGQQIWNHPGMTKEAKQRFLKKAQEHAPNLAALMAGKRLSSKAIHAVAEEAQRLVVKDPDKNPGAAALVEAFQGSLQKAAGAAEDHAEAEHHFGNAAGDAGGLPELPPIEPPAPAAPEQVPPASKPLSDSQETESANAEAAATDQTAAAVPGTETPEEPKPAETNSVDEAMNHWNLFGKNASSVERGGHLSHLASSMSLKDFREFAKQVTGEDQAGNKRSTLSALKKHFDKRPKVEYKAMTPREQAAARRVISSVVGGRTPKQIHARMAASLGVPHDSVVHVVYYEENDGGRSTVTVTVHHPKLSHCCRAFGLDADGKREIINSSLEVKPEFQKQGLGLDIFSKQVHEAAKNGVNYITTYGVGSKGNVFNGYYTWPRFGYDQSFDVPDWANQAEIFNSAKEAFPGAKSVLDVMSTEKGRQWWKENGESVNLKFDLTPGSRSMQVLEAYQQEKAAIQADKVQQAVKAAPEPAEETATNHKATTSSSMTSKSEPLTQPGSDSTSKTNEQPRAPATPHLDASKKKFTEAMNAPHNRHVSPEQMQQYHETMHNLLHGLPESMLSHIHPNVDNIYFHGDPKEIGAVGRFDENDNGPGDLRLTGDYTPDPSSGEDPSDWTANHTWAHEIGHAIDSHRRFSDDLLWRQAWQQEIDQAGHLPDTQEWQPIHRHAPQGRQRQVNVKNSGILSKYAREDPSEGFAELVRKIAVGAPHETMHEYFPQSMAYLKSKGLL